jgi:phage shock protein A
MASKLFDRIGRLLKADAHGVIEALEERSLLLKQCVREAEIALNRTQARLEALRDEVKRLQDTLGRAADDTRSLDDDLTLALGSGKDQLARFAARRLVAHRRTVETLQTRLAECREEEQRLAPRVEAQHAQFETLRARVRTELAHRDDSREHGASDYPAPVADEDVELELLRRRLAPGHGATEGER